MAFHVARRAPGARFQFTLAQLLGMAAWLAAYAGAWRIAWTTMLQQYAALPKSPPSCYIATAAARGHPWLVRAEQRFGPDGRAYRVNDQMRYLKAGELLLAVTCPSLHRLCRTIYDRLGPRLAACLVHPLLADAAYMALKPAEWLCRLLIAMLLPGWADLVRRMYGSGQTPTGAPNLGAPNSPLLRAGRGMTSGSPHWLESRL